MQSAVHDGPRTGSFRRGVAQMRWSGAASVGSTRSMSRISRLMFANDGRPVTLPTSHRRPVALDPPDTTNRVTERLTMTYPHLRQRQRRAAAVAVPLVAGMLLAACGSGDSG